MRAAFSWETGHHVGQRAAADEQVGAKEEQAHAGAERAAEERGQDGETGDSPQNCGRVRRLS